MNFNLMINIDREVKLFDIFWYYEWEEDEKKKITNMRWDEIRYE